jgi:hypothetical protein
VLDDFDGRQVLHVTFGDVLTNDDLFSEAERRTLTTRRRITRCWNGTSTAISTSLFEAVRRGCVWINGAIAESR